MRRLLSVLCALAVMVSVGVAQEGSARKDDAGKSAPATGPLELKSLKDKASYTIGFNIGSSLMRDEVELDPAFIFEGLSDAIQGKRRRLTDEEIEKVMKDFQEQVGKRQQARNQSSEKNNTTQGAAFLAANAKKPGVVTLPSGLQYKVVKAGTGATPTAQDTVKTHYRGTLINGKEFDSSYSRGKPAQFPVSGVIRGWTEALQKMKVGAKWQLYIPSNLAYGPRGAGSQIGPNATLIFDIELLEIVK